MSDKRVSLRVYPEEKQKLRERAASSGFSMSEYLRWLVEWEERHALTSSIYPMKNVRTINKD